MKEIILFLFGIALFSCSNPETEIEKYLNQKYVAYELIEVKEDSSNIITVKDQFRALKMNTADRNNAIAKLFNEMEKATTSEQMKQYVLKSDSIYSSIKNLHEQFESNRFKRPDVCVYVKYLLPDGNIKIQKEEYLYINAATSEYISRPVNWDDFLLELKYDELIKEAIRFGTDIREMKSIMKL